MSDTVSILGVKVNRITMNQAIDQILAWTKGKGKHYVVTPNIEFVMLAQKDAQFKQLLNKADLAIPDSARFSWAVRLLNEKSGLKRLLLWPTFLVGNRLSIGSFPVVTGTDLMEQLCKIGSKEGLKIGLIGGAEGVAAKTAQQLSKRFDLVDIFSDSGGVINAQGEQLSHHHLEKSAANIVPKLDILFVAFGQGKQERWIVNNLDQLPVKVAIGVGGAFDYLSGSVPRAPLWMRNAGLEWLYRIIVQPWRIKRFTALFQFIFQILRA